MTPEIAKELNKFIHTSWPALSDYILDRINTLHLHLEKAEPDQVQKIQGGIEELRRMLKLPEYTKSVLEQRK